MYDLINDAQYALDRHHEKLHEAEQRYLIQFTHPRQSKLRSQMRSQLAAWTNLTHLLHIRIRRA